MRARSLVWAIGLFAVLGCDEERSAPAAPRSRVESALPAPEEELPPGPSAAWPSDVESLREAVDRFTTVDACLEELRARTPTAVSEGVADLSYDGFFDHLCEGLAAVRAGSVEGCDALGISSARAGCRRRLALVHARPDACPDDRGAPGREPRCVAWAARDPGLCRAARDDAHCRAVLAGDERECRALRGGDRERCAAEVRRYSPVLGEERADSPATRAPAVLTLELREQGTEPLVIARDVLARGVRLVPEGCRWSVALADPLGEPGRLVGLEREPASFRLALSFPAERAAPLELALGAEDALLSVESPRHGDLTSIAGARGHVRLERFEPRRGGALSGRITGSLRHGESQIPVRGRFTTFVRDLDPLPAACAALEE